MYDGCMGILLKYNLNITAFYMILINSNTFILFYFFNFFVKFFRGLAHFDCVYSMYSTTVLSEPPDKPSYWFVRLFYGPLGEGSSTKRKVDVNTYNFENLNE